MESRSRVTLWSLILLSVLARRATLDFSRLGCDLDSYLLLAKNLALKGTFGLVGNEQILLSREYYSSVPYPTAFRPPLYPVLISPCYWLDRELRGLGLSAVTLLHVCWGAATTLLTWRVGVRFGLGAWSCLAAALVAIDPLLVYWASAPMTETLAALLFVASVAVLGGYRCEPGRASSWAAGLLLGLGMLCRTTLWAFALSAVLVRGLARDMERRRHPMRAGFVLLVALAVQGAWVIRNSLQLGWPVLTTTHGGYTLLLANNDVFYNEVIHGPPGATWAKQSLIRWQDEMRQMSRQPNNLNEVQYDTFCYKTAWNTIRARPVDFLRSVAYRVVSFWRLFPHATESYSGGIRLGCALFYVPEFACMLIALASPRAWQWPWILLPVALASFTLVHAVYWSDMRMRAPVMPAVALLAAMGAARVSEWLRGRAREAEPMSS